MKSARMRTFKGATLAALLSLNAMQASAAYDSAFCQSVAGTLNIHWRLVSGPALPCTGIEFTDGVVSDAADGHITMNGTGVSNPLCIGVAAYDFTMSPDGTVLDGFDTLSVVPMTLTRQPGQACFVGTWTSGGFVYEAHIWARAFPLAVPALGASGLGLLALLLAMTGGLYLRRRGNA